MKRIFKWIPVVIAVLGATCALLRNALFAAADDRGLLPVGQPAGILLAVIPFVVLAILLWYFLKGSQKEYRWLVSAPVQGIGCLAGAAAHIYWFFTAPDDGRMIMVLKLIAAVCFAALAVYRLMSKKAPLMVFALICISIMGLCFTQYRGWGRHTQLQEYLFPALSALSMVLYSLEYCNMELSEKPYKKAFLLNLAALFSTMACCDSENWPYYLLMSLWLVSGLFVSPYKMDLPKAVQECMEKLEKAGYSVYAVGGCVRDGMFGLTPNDYDLCTNATPEQICQVFAGCGLVRNGEKHGTIGVICDHKVYEITTYRTEGGYADHRHPDQVEFVNSVEEDLARRDFTVNAMAFHPKTGYVDPYGGQKDLFSGVLRTVGDPETRFREDGLRILRGVRFACRFRFHIHPKTKKAMDQLAPLLDEIAQERIAGEMSQILCHMDKGDLIRFRAVLLQIIPELKASVDFQQHSPYHNFDVFTHTDYVLAAAEKDPAVRWAALLHDVGKPQVFTQDESGKGHFYGHAEESAKTAEAILRRLKVSNELREQVVFLIAHHMDTLTPEKAVLRRKLSKYGMDNLKKLIALQQADQAGKGKKPVSGQGVAKMYDMLEQLEKEEGRLQIRDLAVNGHDLMELGYTAGPQLGQCQKVLLELVLSGELPNEKQALLEKARELLER